MQQDDLRTQNTAPPPPQAGPIPPTYVVGDGSQRNLPFKQAWLAGILSGLFPGVGQLYVGYVRQGIIMALVFVSVITALANESVSGMEPLFGMSLGFIWIYGIIDASRRAQAVNRSLAGLGDQPLPDDLKLPGGGGSMAGGVTLVALGLIMLANTRFDMNLQWLADWWPLGLVGLGGWLIWKARAEQATDPEEGSGSGKL